MRSMFPRLPPSCVNAYAMKPGLDNGSGAASDCRRWGRFTLRISGSCPATVCLAEAEPQPGAAMPRPPPPLGTAESHKVLVNLSDAHYYAGGIKLAVPTTERMKLIVVSNHTFGSSTAIHRFCCTGFVAQLDSDLTLNLTLGFLRLQRFICPRGPTRSRSSMPT